MFTIKIDDISVLYTGVSGSAYVFVLSYLLLVCVKDYSTEEDRQ